MKIKRILPWLAASQFCSSLHPARRIPVLIGRSWVNTSDSYSLRPDGKITVVYEGFAGSPKGARMTRGSW
jgi:hypothetical protein